MAAGAETDVGDRWAHGRLSHRESGGRRLSAADEAPTCSFVVVRRIVLKSKGPPPTELTLFFGVKNARGLGPGVVCVVCRLCGSWRRGGL